MLVYLVKITGTKHGLELVDNEAAICWGHYDVGDVVSLMSLADVQKLVDGGIAVSIMGPVEVPVGPVGPQSSED